MFIDVPEPDLLQFIKLSSTTFQDSKNIGEKDLVSRSDFATITHQFCRYLKSGHAQT